MGTSLAFSSPIGSPISRQVTSLSHPAADSFLMLESPERLICSSSFSLRGAFVSSLASSYEIWLVLLMYLYRRILQRHHTTHQCFIMPWSLWPWHFSMTPDFATSKLDNTLPRRQRASWKPSARSRISVWYKHYLSSEASTAPRAIKPWDTCTLVRFRGLSIPFIY